MTNPLTVEAGNFKAVAIHDACIVAKVQELITMIQNARLDGAVSIVESAYIANAAVAVAKVTIDTLSDPEAHRDHLVDDALLLFDSYFVPYDFEYVPDWAESWIEGQMRAFIPGLVDDAIAKALAGRVAPN